MQAYVTFHSYGQVFIYPYSYAVQDAPNKDELVSRVVSYIILPFSIMLIYEAKIYKIISLYICIFFSPRMRWLQIQQLPLKA